MILEIALTLIYVWGFYIRFIDQYSSYVWEQGLIVRRLAIDIWAWILIPVLLPVVLIWRVPMLSMAEFRQQERQRRMEEEKL